MYKKTSKTAYKQTFNPEPLRRCWKECLEKSSFFARKKAAEEFNGNNYWKKRGLAVVPMKFSVAVPIAFYNQVRWKRWTLLRAHLQRAGSRSKTAHAQGRESGQP